MTFKEKKKYNVGLLIDTLSESVGSYQKEILRGIINEAQEQNVSIICAVGGNLNFSHNNQYEKNKNIVYSLLNNKNLDGILFTGLTIKNYISEEEFSNFCKKYHPLPMVSIGGPIRGYNSVLIDNEIGFYQVLKHLVEVHDYRNIAFIKGPENNIDAIKRFDIYKKIINEFGLKYNEDLIVTGDFVKDAGKSAIEELIDKKKIKLDAIVASNDNMALGAFDELSRRGNSVPFDVAIVGFDDIVEAEAYSLTTVRQPIYLQGKEALKVLLRIINGQNISEDIVLSTEPVFRKTCGCLSFNVTNFSKSLNDDTMIFDLEALYTKASRIMDVKSHKNILNSIKELIDIFLSNLKENSFNTFFMSLAKIINNFKKHNLNTSQLQNIITFIKDDIMQNISDEKKYDNVDNILHQSRIFINEESINVQKIKLIEEKAKYDTLENIGQKLNQTFDLDELLMILEDQISRIDIKRCHILLFNDIENKKLTELKHIFAYENGIRKNIENQDTYFDSKKIFSELFSIPNRFDVLIYSLYFKENYIGILTIEGQLNNSYMYESLYNKLCNSLQGTIIFEKNKETQNFLLEKDKNIQNLVEPMLNSINQVSNIATENAEIVKQITGSMTNTWNIISKTNDALEKSLKNITKMIELTKVIDDMSIRINIVALNASIEATRVGEEGKGFSVISKEIRKLSDITKNHANEISDSLNTVINSIKGSIEIANENQKIFSNLENMINGLLASFNTITNRMSELSQKSNLILQSMDIQLSSSVLLFDID